MNFKLRIKNFIFDCSDILKEYILKRAEVKKIKSKEHFDVYKNTYLSEEQKRNVDELYLTNYGKKISYKWHQNYTSYTGHFDINFFPELLYIPKFERYMNLNKDYSNVFENKSVLNYISNNSDIKMPKNIFSCIDGFYKDENYNDVTLEYVCDNLSNYGYCFIKPTVDTCSGEGCQLLNLVNGFDMISKKSLKDIIIKHSSNFVVQERIECSDSIKKIHPESVNTLRVMTYRWKNEILVVPLVLRIGQNGNFLDNAHAGGMFIAVENDGTLHETAFTEFNIRYNIHPNSKIIFKNYKIKNVEKVIQAAVKMHKMLPNIGCVNWDFTIDREDVPVLIEANINSGGIWIFEMAWGKGPFGVRTAEILRWINFMEKVKPHDRINYKYGRMK